MKTAMRFLLSDGKILQTARFFLTVRERVCQVDLFARSRRLALLFQRGGGAFTPVVKSSQSMGIGVRGAVLGRPYSPALEAFLAEAENGGGSCK